MSNGKDDRPSQAGQRQRPEIIWDDSAMRSTYANVVNVASTREEITLLFGTNDAWNAEQDKVRVKLSDRVILNPYAARRLLLLLNGVVQEYERRHGKLELQRSTTTADEGDTGSGQAGT